MKLWDAAKCCWKQVYQLILPPTVCGSAYFHLSLSAPHIINLFNFCQPIGWKYHLVILVCIFLITNEVEQLFMFTVICLFYLVNCSFPHPPIFYLATCFFPYWSLNLMSYHICLPTYLCCLLILMLTLYIFLCMCVVELLFKKLNGFSLQK